MSEHAGGAFDVKLAPETVTGRVADASLGQMSIDKTFHGDLKATSTGAMLTAGTAAKGSADYVALEKVTGTLKARAGSFILMHNATMTRGEGLLNVIVVPDSGTGALAGLTGKMTIRIEAGKHLYDFDYELPLRK
ncbi:MAG TPA: DUF3224 domain-containing protein [Rhizomicrobium sp.]